MFWMTFNVECGSRAAAFEGASMACAVQMRKIDSKRDVRLLSQPDVGLAILSPALLNLI